jgi:hypothetical protein
VFYCEKLRAKPDRLSRATVAGPYRSGAFIHRFGSSQWPLYSDKPTLNIDVLQHRIGMALVTTQEA